MQRHPAGSATIAPSNSFVTVNSKRGVGENQNDLDDARKRAFSPISHQTGI